MIRLATSSVELVNTLMQFHMKHMEGKYKRKFHNAQVRLISELNKPPHLRFDSVIDDLRDQLVMLLDNFRQEIGTSHVQKKNI
jgi:hypothetical protein